MEMGVGWMIRTAASTMKYGVNSQTITITQDGPQVTVVTAGGPKTQTITFVFGVNVVTETPDGRMVTVVPEMSHDRVWTMTSPKVITTRVLTPEGKIKQCMMAGNATAVRLYTKQ